MLVSDAVAAALNRLEVLGHSVFQCVLDDQSPTLNVI